MLLLLSIIEGQKQESRKEKHHPDKILPPKFRVDSGDFNKTTGDLRVGEQPNHIFNSCFLSTLSLDDVGNVQVS